MPKELRVLFVGSFTSRAADGATGGQIAQSRALLASPLSEHIEWLLLDSTQLSQPLPPLYRRAMRALARLGGFVRMTAFGRRPDLCLIFCAHGASFLEKGLMTLFAQAIGVSVILCPRSGFTARDVERSSFWRWLVTYVVRHASATLCQTEKWYCFYSALTGLNANRLFVLDWFDSAGRDQSGDAPNRKWPDVLFLGWVEREKGVLDLLDAFSRYHHLMPATTLHLGGGGTLLDEVRQLVQKRGLESRVKLLDWVHGDQKSELMRQCGVFVLPSHAEGLPQALLEAMAAGMAPIATAVGGIPDLLANPLHGRVVPVGDIDLLGKAMVEYSTDPALARKTGLEAKEHATKRHDIRFVWPRLLEIMRNVARKDLGSS